MSNLQFTILLHLAYVYKIYVTHEVIVRDDIL